APSRCRSRANIDSLRASCPPLVPGCSCVATPGSRCVAGCGRRPSMAGLKRAFAGAVLTGGASRRMGRDQALLPGEGTPLAARFAAGERAVHRAVDGLHVVVVPLADPRESTNLNTPADLAGL